MSFLVGVLIFTVHFLNSSVVAQSENDWPKIIETGETKVTVYQPQLDSLIGDVLYGMSAIAYSKNGGKMVFGAIWFAATLDTDRSTRRSAIDAVNVYEVRFPEDSGMDVDLEEASVFFSNEIPAWELEFSLDEIVASLEAQEKVVNPDFNDDPPEIIYATTPTVLVMIDGDPQWQSITGSVQRVVNTPALVFRNEGKYYILGNGLWYESVSMKEWTHIDKPPKDVRKAVDELLSDDAKKQLKEDASDIVVDIIVRSGPAELVQTDGEADLLPISGTNLLYVTNSESDLVLDITRQQYYLLISGRWFVSGDLYGDWKFLPPTQLPDDFGKIPEGNVKDGVLSNVPGTDANREALMDSQVPQTAAIDRETATTEVSYDGTPEFEPIEDTELSYAENSDKQVIKYKGYYYAVDDGIWYKAESPDGPWFVSTERPPGVDDIPATNPVYNVKYVYIYDVTPQYVYCGYLPAYTGCYIYGGVPVYGTGWWYRPWYRTWYYPRPYTWGFSMHYNPWYGFSMGMHYSVGGPYFNFSIHYGSWGYRGPYRGWYGGYFGCRNWRPPYHPPRGGWYGPRGPTVINNTTVNINNNRARINNIERNNNYGNLYGNKGWGGSDNLGNRPSTREGDRRPGVAKTGTRPSTSDAVRPGGTRPAPNRPSTGDRTRPANRPNTGGTSPSIDRGTLPESRPSTRPAQRPAQPQTTPSNKKQPTRPSTGGRDLYSDPRGRTYERNNNQWQSTRPSQPAQRPSNSGSFNGRDLNRDAYSRQRSQQRSSNYGSRAARPSPRGGRRR